MTETELRNKVVSTMRGWLGWSERNGRHKKIIDIYNAHRPLAVGYRVKYTDEWCATTVSAAAIQCGLTDIMFTECSCPRMIELYKKKGRWMEQDGYKPAPGDIIMYHWKDGASFAATDCTGNPNHVGIVERIVGGSITVIEGNKGEAVARRTLSVNGRYIRGYCLPDYAKKAGQVKPSAAEKEVCKVNLPVLTKGSKGDSVKALQILLNGYGCSCGTADGSFGPATLAAVKMYQQKNKLAVDGSVGPATWKSLLL